MRRLGIGLVLGLALLGLGLPASGRAAAAGPEPALHDGLYRVDQVVDGYRLTVVGLTQRVRLAGIVAQPLTLGVTDFFGGSTGNLAQGFLEALLRLDGGRVWLERAEVAPLNAQTEVQAYAFVLDSGVGTELFVEEEMIGQGLASVDDRPEALGGRYYQALVEAQETARAFGRGQWGAVDVDPYRFSAAPSDGACASGFPIVGFITALGQRRYMPPGSAGYARVSAVECFPSEENAQAAGYRRVSW